MKQILSEEVDECVRCEHVFRRAGMDVCMLVMMYLNPAAVLILGSCDIALREATTSDSVWMSLCKRDFGERKRFGKLLGHLTRVGSNWRGDEVTFAIASSRAGIDTAWLSKERSRWQSLYYCTPRLRCDGVYVLHQRRISAREQSLLEVEREGEMTDEQIEESWKPVIRDSYSYIRFLASGEVHYMIHFLPPNQAIPLMMEQALNIHRNNEISTKLQFYTGSYFLRPRKRSVEIRMYQGRYFVHMLLTSAEDESFYGHGAVDSLSGSSSSNSYSSSSNENISGLLHSLHVLEHDAIIMNNGKPEGHKLEFKLYDPSKNYEFVRYVL